MLVVLVAERRLPDIERSGGRRRGERKRAKEDEAGESFGGAWRRETHTHSGSTMRLTLSESLSWAAVLVLLAVRWSDCSK